MGLKMELPAPQALGLWPCHVRALRVFARSLTQWQMGPTGPIGLRYEAVHALLQIEQIPPADWSATLEDVQVMEREALLLIGKKK